MFFDFRPTFEIGFSIFSVCGISGTESEAKHA